MKTTHSEGPIRSYFAAILVVLVAVAASVAAIVVMKAQEIPTLDNDTAWLEAYISKDGAIPLSEQQKRIIHASAAITSAVAEDAGVTVKLQAVCGNGYQSYYKVEVVLSEEVTAGRQYTGVGFGDVELRLNDGSIGISNGGFISEPLEDDNHLSLLLNTRLALYPGFDYGFDNGIIRTLHLGTLHLTEEGGEKTLIEGQWDFGILFRDRGETVELVQEPMTVRGVNFINGTDYLPEIQYYEAEVSSFILTEFSVCCQYKLTPGDAGQPAGFRPVIIMRDGRTVGVSFVTSGSDGFRGSLRVPVSLDEIAFVKLTDDVILPVNPLR
jgi:hypothetical protein